MQRMERMRDGKNVWEMRITRCNARLTPIPYVERLIGSIRRECLDRVIIINAAHLRRVLSLQLVLSLDRTHLGLGEGHARSRPIAGSVRRADHRDP